MALFFALVAAPQAAILLNLFENPPIFQTLKLQFSLHQKWHIDIEDLSFKTRLKTSIVFLLQIKRGENTHFHPQFSEF